ncbi:MAG TPA: acyl-CoA dehydrogenase family protein [Chloroflexia bacterium]|nr:acyl-CoA dehydrogenase family protein [Chloroflexia bacterium]
MDFSWTEAQEALYKQILDFARDTLNRTGQEHTLFSKDHWSLTGREGLPGLSIPPEYGGRGFKSLDTAHLVEAFGRGCHDMGLVFSVAAHLFACAMPIVEFGSPEIKARVLPNLAQAEWVGANAITEPEAGSDVFALKTTAVRDGSDYLLSGVKSYVTNGPIADLFVVYATTNPANGYLGISGFIVEKDRPGLRLGQQISKMGVTSTPACPVYLEECRVPATNRLGAEGQGALIFKSSMQWERACLFAAYLGMLDRQLEQTVAYARTRRQFGKSIGKNQAISHRVADMKLRLEAARLLLYRACWLFDQGKFSILDISLAKLAVSEAAVQSSLDAIQIHGSTGFNTEAGLERMLRDAIPSRIFSGTSEMQRDIIARELGL